MITAQNPLHDDVRKAIAVIKKRLPLFNDFSGKLKNGLFRNIVICKNLQLDGEWQSAMTNATNKTIYLDTEELKFGSEVLLRDLDHEIFHVISFVLNEEKSFQDLIEIFRNNSHDNTQGFISEYSRSNVYEDMAELYSYTISNKNLVKELCNSDICIKSKVAAIKKFIDNECDTKFFPSFQ